MRHRAGRLMHPDDVTGDRACPEQTVSGTPADSLAWVVGSEAHGVSTETRAQLVDTSARIADARARWSRLNAADRSCRCAFTPLPGLEVPR
jgi:hypothetical protein